MPLFIPPGTGLSALATSELMAERVLWKLVGANMNSTADQAFIKQFTFSNFLITHLRVVNTSASLTLAAGGIYTAASKGGSAIVAATQLYSGLTGATLGLDLTAAAVGLGQLSATALYLALTTAQGTASTADIYLLGVALS